MNNIKFKGNILTQKKIVNNLVRYYNLANDSEINEGLKWYTDANQFAVNLSNKYNIPLHSVCGIIAALSPQTSWLQNKILVNRFLKGDRLNMHTTVQMDKAIKCLNSNETEIYGFLSIGHIKTTQFYYNILNPLSSFGATIDRHALLACLKRPILGINSLNDSMSSMTKNQYRFFELCYIVGAKQLDILPHEFQAIIWVVVRRLRELTNETILIKAPF